MRNNRMAAAAVLFVLLCSCVSLKSGGPVSSDRDIIVKAAISMLDTFYAYGKQTEYKGFDCSGLVQYAYKQAGINIPRTVKQQYEKCVKTGMRDLRPGDLVFFSTYAAGPTHVGVYAGDGKFIHSPTTGKKVDISDINNPYWTKAFYGAGFFVK